MRGLWHSRSAVLLMQGAREGDARSSSRAPAVRRSPPSTLRAGCRRFTSAQARRPACERQTVV